LAAELLLVLIAALRPGREVSFDDEPPSIERSRRAAVNAFVIGPVVVFGVLDILELRFATALFWALTTAMIASTWAVATAAVAWAIGLRQRCTP